MPPGLQSAYRSKNPFSSHSSRTANLISRISVSKRPRHRFTISINSADALVVSLASPLYTAVIACVPLGKAIGRTATPALKGTVPSTVCAPLKKSTNWTLPVATVGETIAVKFTVCPAVAGLTSTESAVEVLALIDRLGEGKGRAACVFRLARVCARNTVRDDCESTDR